MRVGALESIAATVLPELLDAHSNCRPHIEVDLHVDADRSRLLAALASDELDAVLLFDVGEHLGGLGFDVPTEQLEHLHLADIPPVLVAARGAQVDPGD